MPRLDPSAGPGTGTAPGPSLSAYASRFLNGSLAVVSVPGMRGSRAGGAGGRDGGEEDVVPLFHSELPDPYTASPPGRGAELGRAEGPGAERRGDGRGRDKRDREWRRDDGRDGELGGGAGAGAGSATPSTRSSQASLPHLAGSRDGPDPGADLDGAEGEADAGRARRRAGEGYAHEDTYGLYGADDDAEEAAGSSHRGMGKGASGSRSGSGSRQGAAPSRGQRHAAREGDPAGWTDRAHPGRGGEARHAAVAPAVGYSTAPPRTPARPPAPQQTRTTSGRGWLAHQSVVPPGSSSGTGTGTASATASEGSTPPPGMMGELDTDDDEDEYQHRAAGERGRFVPRAQNARGYDAADELSSEGDDAGYADDLDPPDYLTTRARGASPSMSSADEHDPHGPDTAATGAGAAPRSIFPLADDPLGDTTLTLSGQDIPRRLEVYPGRAGVWADLRAGERPLAVYRDAGWLALWLASVLGVVLALGFVWGATDPAPRPPNIPPSAPYRTPFATLLHTLPLLAVLTGLAIALPLAFLYVLKKAVRPVLTTTAGIIPAALFLCGWWGLAASFEDVRLGTDPAGGAASGGGNAWWGTAGLRLFALVPMLLAGVFAWMVWKRRERLERTVGVVELSAGFLLEHPPLLVVYPFLLAALLLLSFPYLTLLLRLLLIGYYRHPRENTYVWHVRPYADWLAVLVVILWLWTWGVVRGVGRVVVAAVVGEWYFHRDEAGRRPVVDTTVSAMHRATGPSLGSICVSALIVAVLRVAGQLAARARRIVHPRANILPPYLHFLTALTPLFTSIASILDQLNGYALVYVGTTGEPFWPSAKRAVRLAGKRRGNAGRLLDYTLIKLLLTLSSTTLAILTAMAGYLFAVHALGVPSHAPLAALLCGGVPFLAFRAGAGVLGDASDALFICYAIDREAGGSHCDMAAKAFGGDLKPPDESMA